MQPWFEVSFLPCARSPSTWRSLTSVAARKAGKRAAMQFCHTEKKMRHFHAGANCPNASRKESYSTAEVTPCVAADAAPWCGKDRQIGLRFLSSDSAFRTPVVYFGARGKKMPSRPRGAGAAHRPPRGTRWPPRAGRCIEHRISFIEKGMNGPANDGSRSFLRRELRSTPRDTYMSSPKHGMALAGYVFA